MITANELSTWKQFWGYLKSDICNKDNLSIDLYHLLLNEKENIQFEILEYAPKEILVGNVLKIIHPVVRARLNIPVTEQDVIEYINSTWR